MKIASVSETKNHLSALLGIVKQGEVVLIMDRGNPVARLEPISFTNTPEFLANKLNQLERQGIIKMGHKNPCSLVAPPRATASIVQAVVQEREKNR